MKKVLFSLGLCSVFFGLNAQQFQVINQPIPSIANLSSSLKVAASSTLTPPSLAAGACGTNTANIGLYGIPAGSGYIFGTNTQTVSGTPTYTVYFGECAQKYTTAGTGASVIGVIVVTAEASSSAAVTQIKAKVYSENASTKAPAAQQGSSASRPLNTLTSLASGSNGLNAFTFATPIPVTGNFFVAIESPRVGGATQDTLGILSTAFGCSSADTLSWLYVQEASNPTVGTWVSVKTLLGGNAQDLDILLFAIVDIPSGINEVTKGNLSLSAAFPNPASDLVSLNFGLQSDARITTSVYDVTGKLVKEIRETTTRPAGKHSIDVGTSELEAGTYIYSIDAAGTRIFSRFVIVK